ncbi:MAG TPA: hypothetical protein VFF06_12420 [Polyangia bacterium]|nr:hypothetical protein [Polyangia bacterium]
MSRRAITLALTLALAGCAPMVDLPQPTSPFSYREPPRVIESPTPDPNGPCVQRASRRHAGTWLWKHGVLVEHRRGVSSGLVAATADYPPANALARAARARDRALLPLFITHGALLIGTFSSLIALDVERPDDGRAVGLAVGVGFGLMAVNVSTLLALGIGGAHREQRALDVYNSWAADHGCSDPPATSTRR